MSLVQKHLGYPLGNASGPVRTDRALQPCDLDAAFRCIYDCYTRRRLAATNPLGLRMVAQHLLPATQVFCARTGGNLLGTLSLVDNALMPLPMACAFAPQLARLQRPGVRLGEATCLAIRRSLAISSLAVIQSLMGASAQAAQRRGITHICVTVHPRHAPFYVREAGFRQFGPTVSYPPVGRQPATPLLLDLVRLPDEHPSIYRKYFGMTIADRVIEPRPLSMDALRHVELRWLSFKDMYRAHRAA